MEIIGREEELAELRGFVDAVDRVPAAILVGGEPGVGKTILWLAGVELAWDRGLRMLAAIPATVEIRLFVTPTTAGTQQSRVYSKVGVHSGTELARQLGDDLETPRV